jgi:hypothetical protein
MWQTGMFGIAMFLMKDWRNTPGTAEVLPFLDKVCYVPCRLLLIKALGAESNA